MAACIESAESSGDESWTNSAAVRGGERSDALTPGGKLAVSHQPVLVQEILQGLALQAGAVVLDATVGLGGHAEAMARVIGPKGCLIGVDRDPQALEMARQRLKPLGVEAKFIHGNFGELMRLLDELNVEALDAVLVDLGVSSFQLETPARGFSFSREGPLDMRMDPTGSLTAAEIVNQASQEELKRLLQVFGEERWSGRIARAIVEKRPFTTTTALAETIRQAVPSSARRGRIDPATRTFQALRIAVNQELELLPIGLEQGIQRLKTGGRIAVLAYHSLEDRIVKTLFRTKAREGALELITRKPVRPSEEEVARNPRSRSARLRIAQRMGSI